MNLDVNKLEEPWMSQGADAPKFKVGDWVDLKRWDATVPAKQRLGVQRVLEVKPGQYCQSGVMVTITGYANDLDQDWLTFPDESKGKIRN